MSHPSPSSVPADPHDVPPGQAPEGAAQPASSKGRESRYRARPAPAAAVAPPPGAGTQRRVLRPVLTEPDTAPMSPQQHEQAVNTLAAMIVAWWQRTPAADGQNPVSRHSWIMTANAGTACCRSSSDMGAVLGSRTTTTGDASQPVSP
jgi:hypothetical protein